MLDNVDEKKKCKNSLPFTKQTGGWNGLINALRDAERSNKTIVPMTHANVELKLLLSKQHKREKENRHDEWATQMEKVLIPKPRELSTKKQKKDDTQA